MKAAQVQIKKKNELYLVVECEPNIRFALAEKYSFEVQGHKFMPTFRSGVWDGKIRLFSITSGQIYYGLLNNLTNFLDESGYTWELENIDKPSTVDVDEYIESLKLPFEIRDYQIETIKQCITNHRRLIISPTSSGKTLSLYAIANYYKQFGKVLILFPNTNLVMQTRLEFIKYGMDARCLHEIFEDRSKHTEKSIVLATWQGLYTQSKAYFKQYDCVIVDEAHTAVAKSITTIMHHLENCKYRFGFTGTLSGAKINELQLVGLFGDCNQVVTTKQLIENKQISDVIIKIILLKHNYKMFDSYNDELEYIVTHPGRNKFIENLVGNLKGNTLVLFSRVEQQGLPLYERFTKNLVHKITHLVYGDIKSEKREEIRQIVETQNNAIIVASYQTYQQGINIKNLHNIVFAAPSKSRIRNLQSIGRGLRLHDSKSCATIYDIADDISIAELKNHTLKHLMNRITYYAEEQLNFTITEINIIKKLK